MSRDYYDDEARVIVDRRSGGAGAFLVGLAVGAGLALLFAPQSGAATRRELRRRAERARRRAEDLAHDVKVKAQNRYEEVREDVESRIEDVRDNVNRRKREFSRAMDAGRAAAREARRSYRARIVEADDAQAEEAGEDVAGARDGASD